VRVGNCSKVKQQCKYSGKDHRADQRHASPLGGGGGGA